MENKVSLEKVLSDLDFWYKADLYDGDLLIVTLGSLVEDGFDRKKIVVDIREPDYLDEFQHKLFDWLDYYYIGITECYDIELEEKFDYCEYIDCKKQLDFTELEDKVGAREVEHLSKKKKRIKWAKLPTRNGKLSVDNKDIIIYDLETTGLAFDRDEILQLSIINGDGDVLFNSYFKPENISSWEEAERINHISPEMVKDKPLIKEKLNEILNIFKKAKLIVGYNNVGFDNMFLKHLNDEFENVFNETEQYDAMLQYAEFIGYWDDYHNSWTWYKLEVASKDFGYKVDNQFHDALEDCKATLCVFKNLEIPPML